MTTGIPWHPDPRFVDLGSFGRWACTGYWACSFELRRKMLQDPEGFDRWAEVSDSPASFLPWTTIGNAVGGDLCQIIRARQTFPSVDCRVDGRLQSLFALARDVTQVSVWEGWAPHERPLVLWGHDAKALAIVFPRGPLHRRDRHGRLVGCPARYVLDGRGYPVEETPMVPDGGRVKCSEAERVQALYAIADWDASVAREPSSNLNCRESLQLNLPGPGVPRVRR